MPWKRYNPNPQGLSTGDCTIRAVCAVTGLDWNSAHTALCTLARDMADMPNTNRVWWDFLRAVGFRQLHLLDRCPDCFTVRDFAEANPKGVYVLGPHEHAVAVIDGEWWDNWDSGNTVPMYYFVKEDKNNGMESYISRRVSAGADAGLEQSADVSADTTEPAEQAGGGDPG